MHALLMVCSLALPQSTGEADAGPDWLIGTIVSDPAGGGRVPPPESVFDGKTLTGWKLVGGDGPGYVVEDGCIVCPKDGGGNLFTEKQYGDFVLECEFWTEPGGNNGIGIRAPLEGDAAYVGMEVQILDDAAPQYASLQPGQYCGSLYKFAPVKRGALKPAGEWNTIAIAAEGRRVRVKLNGVDVNDFDLNSVADPATLAEHPGLLRERGHIGFLGHHSLVKYRNIRITAIGPSRPNTPPDGFTALFDGKTLANWKGLVSPDKGVPGRAAMPPDQRAKEQQAADEQMRAHWSVADGELRYDGGGQSLCSARDYGDFELWLDWKIGPKGDSGVYVRGSPQIQIWDDPVGSGGLYNNQKNPSKPLAVADRPVGEWNRFQILMVGERVTVYLNDVLVVHDTPLENYWERGKPIYPTGQIELQHHNHPLAFRNVFVREIGKGGAAKPQQ